jgi:hypothetical protein
MIAGDVFHLAEGGFDERQPALKFGDERRGIAYGARVAIKRENTAIRSF